MKFNCYYVNTIEFVAPNISRHGTLNSMCPRLEV